MLVLGAILQLFLIDCVHLVQFFIFCSKWLSREQYQHCTPLHKSYQNIIALRELHSYTYSTVSRSLWSAVQFASKFFHHCDHCQDPHCHPPPHHRWSLIRKMQASGGRASLFYLGKGRQTNATLCQPTRIARMLLMMVMELVTKTF